MNQLKGLKVGLFSLALALTSCNAHVITRSPIQTGISTASPSPVANTNPPLTKNPVQGYVLDLSDQVVSNSDFFLFRERLRQAIRDRDAEFIRDIATPSIQLTFARPIKFDSLKIYDPNAKFWTNIEKAMALGCKRGKQMESWSCPHLIEVTKDSDHRLSLSSIIIVGTDINIYDQANAEGKIIATLSNAVAQSGYISGKNPHMMEDLKNGWFNIILADGQSGYVQERYAYSPIGHRAYFEKVNGKWKMSAFLAGD